MTTPVAESASAQPKTAAAATPSTTTPAAPSTSTARPTPQPKKKKKSGLASFFAALGCGSSEPLEDKRKPAMSEIHGQSGSATKSVGTKPVAAVAPTKDVAKPTADSTEVTLTEGDNAVTSAARTEPIKTTETTEETPKSGPTVAELGLGAVVGTGAVAGAAVAANAVSGEDTNKEAAVVVAPSTPVQIPEDEVSRVPCRVRADHQTAGMTSAAVQPPGSGSALLAANPPTPDDKTQSSDYVATESNTGTSSQQDYNMMAAEDEEEEDDEDRLVAQGGLGIPIDQVGHCPACLSELTRQDGREMPLLPPMDKAHAGRKCLVLDLDETLLHSSFKVRFASIPSDNQMIPNADYIVPVEIESQTHNVYVIKRPGVDNFLQKMGEIYEVVVFTASLSKVSYTAEFS